MKIKKVSEILNEAFNATKDEEKRFTNFTKELAKISKKYKIGISGNVEIFAESVDIKEFIYTDDATSGDLDFKIID